MRDHIQTVRLTATKRHGGTRTLKIEADGALILVQVGLTDHLGNAVTRIDVQPDDETRGGDQNGDLWDAVPHDSGIGGRVIMRGKTKVCARIDETHPTHPWVDLGGQPRECPGLEKGETRALPETLAELLKTDATAASPSPACPDDNP